VIGRDLKLAETEWVNEWESLFVVWLRDGWEGIGQRGLWILYILLAFR
jgi:hypothetical protein